MHITNFSKFNKIYFINILISLLPLSIIIGNFAINFNIILIIILGLIIYKIDLFFLNEKIFKFLIYTFFFFLISTTVVNNFKLIYIDELYKSHLLKSFFYLRFLFLFLILCKLIENNNLNTKLLYKSCSLFVFVLTFDVIFQYFFGKNILGYPLYNNVRPTSFFREELIAGGYIQKFSLFFIFYIAIKIKKWNSNLTISLLFLFFLLPLVFTLNRMPLIIFLMSFYLYFLVEKKLKQIIISSFFLILIFLSIVNFSSNQRIEGDFKNFIRETTDIFQISPKLFFYGQKTDQSLNIKSHYLLHFNSGIQTWKKNKIIGAGLKSFRLKCSFSENQLCNTHPHNYFIEILVDTGVIGVLLIYSIVIFSLINFLNYYLNEKNYNHKLTSVVFFLLIFCEFFPFRSTGSFFTTANSTYIFLLLPILINIKKVTKL